MALQSDSRKFSPQQTVSPSRKLTQISRQISLKRVSERQLMRTRNGLLYQCIKGGMYAYYIIGGIHLLRAIGLIATDLASVNWLEKLVGSKMEMLPLYLFFAAIAFVQGALFHAVARLIAMVNKIRQEMQPDQGKRGNLDKGSAGSVL